MNTGVNDISPRVMVGFEREIGMTISSITYQVERWASIAAMTGLCQSVAHVQPPIMITHYNPPRNKRRVLDPIDESSLCEDTRAVRRR